MATKTRKRKSQKQKQILENEVLVYVYSLILITISIIGALEIGFVGKLTTNFVQFIFGNLYGIFYLAMIIFSIFLMMRKSIRDLPLKYLIGFSIIMLAWLLAASIPKNQQLKGLDIFSQYLGDTLLILKGEIAAKGGVIGAFLVSISTFLFDYMGTWIVVIAMLALGVILLFHGRWIKYLKQTGNVIKKPFSFMSENNAQRKAEKAIQKQNKNTQQTEDSPIQSRIAPGQVEFLDLEDALDNQSIADIEEEDDYQIGFGVQNVRDKQNESDISIQSFESSYNEDYTKYKLPRLSLLLEVEKRGKSKNNILAANESGRRLIEILDEFGVKATLIATHIGPAVTKFEVKPDLGVRVNKISNLQHDIKMALAARDIRIEAPIPGKSAVGIEIPNVEKTNVSMKDMMRSIPEGFTDKKLMFALGKDLMGNNVYGELNRMPHLLIAGATGSGKSVCVNSIITSILMRAKPDEVKMLLIDPKKVEFTPYKEIPHLIGPVITEGEAANRALKVIVVMMDNRYELFSIAGVRNIAGYNSYIDQHPEEGLHKLPWVVVIIDELADLMLVAAKDVEASIQRITQLARAAGIHLIVATQRPSVDVITGVIKANIPSRIAFAVSSAVDSRTILDHMGAEKLLGYGDMLYMPVGETSPIRVQGVFVSDHEVKQICEFVSKQGKPKYDDAFIRLDTLDTTNGLDVSAEKSDPLYQEVKAFVISTNKASTSLIQRKFSIGYARAARIIDTLEEQGIIGASRGSKPREVYAQSTLQIEDEEPM